MNLKTFLNFWVYVVPFPLYAAFFFYWQARFENVHYALFLLITPTLYGYIIPGIATNLQKKWRFIGPWVVGNYYIHHGFKYAANMNLWFFLASFGVDFQNLTTETILVTAIRNGAIHGFFIWIHDTLSIKYGKIEIMNVLKKPGMSPEAQAFSFAPASFFTLGFCYGLGNLLLYQKIMQDSSWSNLAVCIGMSFMLMVLPSSGVFAYLEKRASKITG